MGIEFLKEYGEVVSKRIFDFLSSKNAPKQLIDAMIYSVGAGGKRLRPALMMQFAKAHTISGLKISVAAKTARPLHKIF